MYETGNQSWISDPVKLMTEGEGGCNREEGDETGGSENKNKGEKDRGRARDVRFLEMNIM